MSVLSVSYERLFLRQGLEDLEMLRFACLSLRHHYEVPFRIACLIPSFSCYILSTFFSLCSMRCHRLNPRLVDMERR